MTHDSSAAENVPHFLNVTPDDIEGELTSFALGGDVDYVQAPYFYVSREKLERGQKIAESILGGPLGTEFGISADDLDLVVSGQYAVAPDKTIQLVLPQRFLSATGSEDTHKLKPIPQGDIHFQDSDGRQRVYIVCSKPLTFPEDEQNEHDGQRGLWSSSDSILSPCNDDLFTIKVDGKMLETRYMKLKSYECLILQSLLRAKVESNRYDTYPAVPGISLDTWLLGENNGVAHVRYQGYRPLETGWLVMSDDRGRFRFVVERGCKVTRYEQGEKVTATDIPSDVDENWRVKKVRPALHLSVEIPSK